MYLSAGLCNPRNYLWTVACASTQSAPRKRGFETIPLDIQIAAEVAALGDCLRDPADQAIVAAARVRRLQLVTSGQRIAESKLVPVVE